MLFIVVACGILIAAGLFYFCYSGGNQDRELFSFTTRDGFCLLADWHRPDKAIRKNIPVLMVPGGAWHFGHRLHMRPFARQMALEGYDVFLTTYRKAPRYRYPQPVLDLIDAAEAFQKKAPQLQWQKQVGFGYSAGAHLLFLAQQEAAFLKISRLVAISCPFDLRPLAFHYFVKSFLGTRLRDNAALYSKASPISYDLPSYQKTIFIHGRWDWIVPVSQAHAMKSACDASSRPAQIEVLNTGHFAVMFLAAKIVKKVARWLAVDRRAFKR